jgi:hypothetical protein
MSERLPAIPEGLVMKAYMPSGRFETRPLVLTALVGVVAGIVGCSLALFLCALAARALLPDTGPSRNPAFNVPWPLFPTPVDLLHRGEALVNAVGQLVLFVAVFLLIFYLAGCALGSLMSRLLRLSKCRSDKMADWIGTIAGAPAGVASLWVMFFSATAAIPEGGILRYSALLISFIGGMVFITAAARVPRDWVRETPYCESCQDWFGKWRAGRFSLSAADVIVELVNSPSPPFAGLEQTKDLPCLAVRVRNCRSCDVGDFQLQVDKESKKDGLHHKERWLDAMVPAAVGVTVRNALLARRSGSRA